jgi:hypothetical protein
MKFGSALELFFTNASHGFDDVPANMYSTFADTAFCITNNTFYLLIGFLYYIQQKISGILNILINNI